MKNLKNVVSVITFALVMLVSVNVSAQNQEYTKAEVSEKLSEVMFSLVESANLYYSKGDSYKAFRSKLYGKQVKINPSKKGEALIKKVYNYISNNASEKSIRNGSVSEIADAYVFIYETEKSNKGANGEHELFGSSTGDFNPEISSKVRCCFFCLSCHFTTVFGEEGGEQVMNGLIKWLLTLIN